MEDTFLQVFSSAGVEGTITLMMFLWIIYYLPKAYNKHIESSEKSQDKFLEALKDTTDKHLEISNKFMDSTRKHGADHQKIMVGLEQQALQHKAHDKVLEDTVKVLKKLSDRQDSIGDDVAVIKNKV